VEHKPTSMIDALTPIWQRVLQQSSIGIEDNFFDLGGDSLLAAALFTEIAQVCGRDLPPVMIYQAPTIATLAVVLEKPTIPQFPPLVRLKAGTKEPPVFIAHGMGGNVMDFYQLVRHIVSPHAIHGMQAKGVDGVDKPFERIEDMAQFFLDAITELQPHGPYLLVGYSLGGLVALELAHRLSENGEEVALLAMLESYPHRRYLSVRQRVRLFTRMARHHAAALLQLPIREVLSYLMNPAERLLYVSRDASGGVHNQPPIEAPFAAATERMRDSAYLALTRYRPRFYRGKIKFVRAEITLRFPDDPTAVWGKLADQLDVETVPGDHHGIITTHYESLAPVLSRYIREAVSQQ
jgi:thioesterase domain-containing protein